MEYFSGEGNDETIAGTTMKEDLTKKKFIPAFRFDWLSPVFDFFISALMPEKKFRTSLVEIANIGPGDKVLDFGFGTGSLAIVTKTLCPLAEVTGIDVDPAIIAIAKKKLQKAGIGIEIVEYEGTKLPFADGTFDRVMSSLVFHHLVRDAKRAMFGELHRVLKKGCSINIADFGKPRNPLMKGISLLLSLIEPVGDNIRGLLPELMKGAGFSDVREAVSYNTSFGTLCIYSGTKREE